MTRRHAFAALRWLALAPALLALAPVAAQAADLRQGQEVTIPAGVTVDDDLYAGAGTVRMDGTVTGSLIAAGGTIDVTGTVQRDVIVTGGTVTISGPVMGSVRAAGGNLRLSGTVGEDVVAAGGTLDVAPGTTIGRDLVVAAGSVNLAGKVARNVKAEVGSLRLESGASVGGNLDYASDNAAQIDSGATVTGTVTHTPSTVSRQPSTAQRVTDGVVGWLRQLVGLFVLGLLVLLLFGAFSRRASDAIGGEPLASLGLGLAALVGVPIAALLVFILGLLVGGWPLALAALALLAIAAAVGYVLAALFVARTGLQLLRVPEPHPVLALLVGLVVLTLVGLVPVLGGLVGLAAIVLGLGALTLTLFRSWRAPAAAA